MSTTRKEVDFPRGKGAYAKNNLNESISQLTTNNNSNKKRKKNDDDLFRMKTTNDGDDGNDGTKKKSRRKRLKQSSTSEEKDDVRIIIERMNLSSIPVGILMLGAIQEINDYEMKMSVAGGCVVRVPITNISSTYTQILEKFAADDEEAQIDVEVMKINAMFQIGQCFPVKIVEKNEIEGAFGGYTRTELIGSINPTDVHADVIPSAFFRLPKMLISAAVASVEDHGYIMDIGMSGIKAFLSNDAAQAHIQTNNNGKKLSLGQLIVCAIDSVVNERSVKLTTKTKIVSKSMLRSDTTDNISLSCLIPGTVVIATVMNTNERGLELNVLDDFRGFVHRNHLASIWDQPKKNYKIGQEVSGTILYVHPVTKFVVISLRAKPNHAFVSKTWADIKVGKIEKAIVFGRDEMGGVVFKLPGNLKAFAPKRQLSDRDITTDDNVDIEQMFPVGSKHKCKIRSICYIDCLVQITLKPSILQKDDLSTDDLHVGTIVKGRVKKLSKGGMVLQLGHKIKGFVPDIHLTEAPHVSRPEKLFPLDKEVKCRIIRLDKSTEPPKIYLTCKKSLLNENLNILSDYAIATPGFQTDGVVALVRPSGLLIEFFNGVRGWVPLRFMSTYKIEYPEKVFQKGQVIKCSVVSYSPDDDRMVCSLIDLKGPNKKMKNMNSEMQPGEILTKLKIIGKSENGFDLMVVKTSVNVFLPFGHLSDDVLTCTQLSETLNVGNVIDEVIIFCVKAGVVIVTQKATFIDAAKSGNFVTNVEDLHVDMSTPAVIEGFAKYGVFVELPGGIKGLVPKRYIIDAPSMEPSECGFVILQTVIVRLVEITESKNSKKGQQKELTFSIQYNAKPHLPLMEGFVWDIDSATPNLSAINLNTTKEELSSEEDTDEEETTTKRKTRKERSEEKRKREEQLRKREQQLTDTQRTPETVDDHERLVLASPNSSLVWLRYMAFYLEQAEIDKARTIGERALKTILFREEQEKLNIWVALLNLENLYGTQDSLQETFDRALKQNEPMKIYKHMISIYIHSEKLEQAEALYHLMLKKFKQDKNVWIDFGVFYMKSNRAESARQLMQRSLKSIPRRDHVDIISKFAQLEFKFGDVERGKTMFENMLSSYPKRSDLWSIYIDMMIKYQQQADDSDTNIDAIRNIFEKVITLKLPARKMKFLFKRYLDFETQYGNEDRIARIKQKAIEYVEAKPIN